MRVKAIALTFMLTAGVLLLPSTAGADSSNSCDNDPCRYLPYSFTVTVNGAVLPHMDRNLFDGWGVDGSAPLLQTGPETYVTNPDGTVTGTVTADMTIGVSVSQPLGKDVTAYFEGGIQQDGMTCPPGPCSVPSFPCTLQAGQTRTTCDFPDWWQSYSSTLAPNEITCYTVIYADPGQEDMDEADGHPYSYGLGWTVLTAFIPTPPGSAPASRRLALPQTRSFTVRYRPTFGANFTLDVIRHGTTIVDRQPLGWRKSGAHSTTFNCLTRHGNLTLVVVGRRPGKVQRSNPKSVTC